MESVARGVQDLPVLMRVPLFFTGDATVCRANSMMLGYGDIAIPGDSTSFVAPDDLHESYVILRGQSRMLHDPLS